MPQGTPRANVSKIVSSHVICAQVANVVIASLPHVVDTTFVAALLGALVVIRSKDQPRPRQSARAIRPCRCMHQLYCVQAGADSVTSCISG